MIKRGAGGTEHKEAFLYSLGFLQQRAIFLKGRRGKKKGKTVGFASTGSHRPYISRKGCLPEQLPRFFNPRKQFLFQPVNSVLTVQRNPRYRFEEAQPCKLVLRNLSFSARKIKLHFLVFLN